MSAPAALNDDANSDIEADLRAALATDGAGVWVAVWFEQEVPAGNDEDVLCACSTNDGASWTSPQILSDDELVTDNFVDEEPRIVYGGGVWIVVWASNNNTLLPNIRGDRDLLARRSAAVNPCVSGWDVTQVVNTDATSDHDMNGNAFAESDPAIATDGAGTFVVLWQRSHSDFDADIFASTSLNAGLTWSSPVAVFTDPDPASGDDGLPAIATDGSTWLAAWQSQETLAGTIGTDNDILFSTSSDAGATWTDAAALNSEAATDGAGDDQHVDLAVDDESPANWVAVWDSTATLTGLGPDRDILVSTSSNATAWSQAKELHDNAASDSQLDEQARIGTDANGNWVAAWRSNENLTGVIGNDGDLLASRSIDNGQSWCPAQVFQSNADSDTGIDANVSELATDRAGNWAFAWNSTDPLGAEMLGADPDILVARFFLSLSPVDSNGDGLADTCDPTLVPASRPSTIFVLATLLAALIATAVWRMRPI